MKEHIYAVVVAYAICLGLFAIQCHRWDNERWHPKPVNVEVLVKITDRDPNFSASLKAAAMDYYANRTSLDAAQDIIEDYFSGR